MANKKLKHNVKRGDIVNVYRVFYRRTGEEISHLREQDLNAGRWCDDGGEPILYSSIGETHAGAYRGSQQAPEKLTVTVTALTSKDLWDTWTRKPKGLAIGWCNELSREVMFQKQFATVLASSEKK